VLSSADAAAAAAAAAAAVAVPALLLLLPCHQPASKARNQQPDIFSKLTRNSTTSPNFVPKMAQNRTKKMPNVSSKILENSQRILD